jgi:phage terminase Nu1 subunit (DNA packaging protein)
MPETPEGGGLGLRAFARRLGVSLPAVQRAGKEGRITITRNEAGRPYIADPEKATAEWEAHTRTRLATNGRADEPSALAKATQRHREAQAKIAEQEYARKAGLLVPVAEVERRQAARVLAVRTKLLSLASRVQQRIPGLTREDLVVIDALVREALEELAEDRKGE